MISIPPLQKGDQVAIVSTARKISQNEIQPAVLLLEQWGLSVVIGKTIGAEEHQFAGGDALRVADFQLMLDNPDIKAIWCARGGYGTVRIIDQLDFSTFKKHPKWIIGYSDVTVLHSHVHNLDFETLHAPMPVDIAKQSDEAIAKLYDLLFGIAVHYQFSSHPKNMTGIASGQVVGGNLSILYSLCGSRSAVTTNGKILFIEDLDEYLYHIDRMLQNLKRNGLFDDLSGLIVGGMSDMRDNTKAFGFAHDNPFGKTAVEIISELVSAYSFPVCFDFPAGHTQNNQALVLGREMQLEVNDSQALLKKA